MAPQGDLEDYQLREAGDFTVMDRHLEEVAEQHIARSEAAKAVDARRRAPVTTNHTIWASDPAHWDYPGVDTPRAGPRLLPKDLMTSAYRRSTVNVRTRDAPEYGGKTPLDPLGSAEVAGEQSRSRAVRRGVAAPSAQLADRMDGAGMEERRQRHYESKSPNWREVPEAVRAAEAMGREASDADVMPEEGILEARKRDDRSMFYHRPR